jgi:secreted trypsin-like serine protease
LNLWGSNRRWQPLAVSVLCGALLALASPAAAGAAPRADASIVGGGVAQIADFPSLAFVIAQEGPHEGFTCSGSVVAPRVVLTAAHCVEDLEGDGGLTPIGDYKVITGTQEPHRAEAGNVFQVAATHVFPGFDPGLLHGDAAILILSRPTTAPLLALAGDADSVLYEGGAPVQLAGWGLTRGDSAIPPRQLRTAASMIQPAKACKQGTRPFYGAYSGAAQMCTLDLPSKSTGACFGDSGGPAIARRSDGSQVEIGIASSVGPECDPRLPDVYTRADTISTWVSEWAGATEAGTPPPAVDASAPLPPMSRGAGIDFAIHALATDLGRPFVEAERGRESCKPAGRSRVGCEFAWIFGRDFYYGKLTVFYRRREDAVVWERHYRIHRVDAKCVLESRHPQSCPARLLHG